MKRLNQYLKHAHDILDKYHYVVERAALLLLMGLVITFFVFVQINNLTKTYKGRVFANTLQ